MLPILELLYGIKPLKHTLKNRAFLAYDRGVALKGAESRPVIA